jgi:peptidoglycan/LPS O-acetylase OafA/YrhL
MLQSLQILRGFAAIIVAIVHVWNDGFLPKLIIEFGEFGVDIFFVLSGFIMCLTVNVNRENEIANSSYFLYRRIIRIFPIYLICAIPLILFITRVDGFKGFYYYLGNLLLLPTFTSDPNYNLALPVGWTLVYEMFFYYIFAIFLLFMKNKKKLISSILLVLFLLVVLVQLFDYQGEKLHWVNFSYIIGDPLLLNFGMGIVSYFIFERFKDKFVINLYQGYLCLFLLSLISIFLIYLQFPRLVSNGIPSFLIILIFLFIPNSQLSSSFSKKLIFIGNASYSIYLTHFYFAFFKPKIYEIGGNYSLNESVVVNSYGIFSLISSIILGCIFYVMIEKPIIHFQEKRYK